MIVATFFFRWLADIDSAAYLDSVSDAHAWWNYSVMPVEEKDEFDGLSVVVIAVIALLVISFFLLSWLNSRYWDRGIFPPFLRFKRSNYYEAVIHVSVNMLRCDSDNVQEKHAQLQHYVRTKFPDIPGGIADSYRSALSMPVSTKSVAAWLGKHLRSDLEKTELLEFLFGLAITDGTLGKKEHAVLLAFTQHIGLNAAIFAKLVDEHQRSRAERLFDEQEQHRKQQTGSKTTYSHEKARAVLGLASGFTQSDLKKAYRQLAKRFHPDRYMHASDEEKQQVSERFIELQEAYEYLNANPGA